jgi:hypothetical protein
MVKKRSNKLSDEIESYANYVQLPILWLLREGERYKIAYHPAIEASAFMLFISDLYLGAQKISDALRETVFNSLARECLQTLSKLYELSFTSDEEDYCLAQFHFRIIPYTQIFSDNRTLNSLYLALDQYLMFASENYCFMTDSDPIAPGYITTTIDNPALIETILSNMVLPRLNPLIKVMQNKRSH